MPGSRRHRKRSMSKTEFHPLPRSPPPRPGNRPPLSLCRRLGLIQQFPGHVVPARVGHSALRASHLVLLAPLCLESSVPLAEVGVSLRNPSSSLYTCQM